MDEATASIDMDTEAVLQDVIAAAFGGKTVFTIAVSMDIPVSNIKHFNTGFKFTWAYV